MRLEESLGGRVFMPSSPGVGQKTLEPRLLDFPHLGKTMDTARDGMTPIGVVPVGASRCGELERVD